MYHYCGQRLSFQGSLCTVRYVGGVENTQGEWLGVEWDEPTRGKHAGEHKGTRYFHCEKGTANLDDRGSGLMGRGRFEQICDCRVVYTSFSAA